MRVWQEKYPIHSTWWFKPRGVVHKVRVVNHDDGLGPNWVNGNISITCECHRNTYYLDPTTAMGLKPWVNRREERQAAGDRFRGCRRPSYNEDNPGWCMTCDTGTCPDCGWRTYWSEIDQQYHHLLYDNPRCFLIQSKEEKVVAANTHEAVRELIGHKIIGVLFDEMPYNRKDLSSGNRTFVLDDGRGFTFTPKGAFWIDSSDDVGRAVAKVRRHLEEQTSDLREILQLAGDLEEVQNS